MLDLQLRLLAQTAPGVEPRATVGAGSPAPAPTAVTEGTSAPGSPTPSVVPETQKSTGSSFLGGLGGILPIALMLGVLYVVLIRGQRKDEKKRKAMISELKKGDRVMTIGGLIARVVSVDGEEVVLKVDESNNVKETYRKSAIQEVLTASGDDKK